MTIREDFYRPASAPPLALSIGMFDGVHLGHQALLRRLDEVAAAENLETAILTFWPHPRTVFSPNEPLHLLNTITEKQYLLRKKGLQHLFMKEFDEAFRNLPAESFVREILVEKLRVKHLIIGHDHTFGKNRSGNFELLQQMGPELGFKVEQIPVVDAGEVHISSTQIRAALHRGEIRQANAMLGYRYSLSGKVVHGKKIGRTIGYPTANIAVNTHKMLPMNGAYIVDVYLGAQHYKGMLSIGTNPTVNGNAVSVEVYILDFDADIYGEPISVNFREFLHDEIKFNSLEELIVRLDEDKKLTAAYNF